MKMRACVCGGGVRWSCDALCIDSIALWSDMRKGLTCVGVLRPLEEECTASTCVASHSVPPAPWPLLCVCCVQQVMNLKNVQRKSLAAYSSPTAQYVPGQRCWNADCKADVALPCATQVRQKGEGFCCQA